MPNVSSGDSGTIPYAVNTDGTYTLNDPHGNLIAAYEVPNYALIASRENRTQPPRSGPGALAGPCNGAGPCDGVFTFRGTTSASQQTLYGLVAPGFVLARGFTLWIGKNL